MIAAVSLDRLLRFNPPPAPRGKSSHLKFEIQNGLARLKWFSSAAVSFSAVRKLIEFQSPSFHPLSFIFSSCLERERKSGNCKLVSSNVISGLWGARESSLEKRRAESTFSTLTGLNVARGSIQPVSNSIFCARFKTSSHPLAVQCFFKMRSGGREKKGNWEG